MAESDVRQDVTERRAAKQAHAERLRRRPAHLVLAPELAQAIELTRREDRADIGADEIAGGAAEHDARATVGFDDPPIADDEQRIRQIVWCQRCH